MTLSADAPPTEGAIIAAGGTGYIQHVDMQALQDCGESLEAEVFLHRLPGSFIAPGTALLSVGSSSLDQELVAALRNGVTIGPIRSFEEDPRFGLSVLTEIASRALAPNPTAGQPSRSGSSR